MEISDIYRKGVADGRKQAMWEVEQTIRRADEKIVEGVSPWCVATPRCVLANLLDELKSPHSPKTPDQYDW